MSDDPIILKLSKPVECPMKGTITELRFRELTGRDLRSMPVNSTDMNLDAFMKMAAKAADVTDAVFDKMAPKDVMAAVGIISPFFS